MRFSAVLVFFLTSCVQETWTNCDLSLVGFCFTSIATFGCEYSKQCISDAGCTPEEVRFPPDDACIEIGTCHSSTAIASFTCLLVNSNRCSDLLTCLENAGCMPIKEWAYGELCPDGQQNFCNWNNAESANRCVEGKTNVECSEYYQCLIDFRCETLAGTVALPSHCRSYIPTLGGGQWCDLDTAAQCSPDASQIDCQQWYTCNANSGCTAEVLGLPPLPICLELQTLCSPENITAGLACREGGNDQCTEYRQCLTSIGCATFADWASPTYCPGESSYYCNVTNFNRTQQCIQQSISRLGDCSEAETCLKESNCEILRNTSYYTSVCGGINLNTSTETTSNSTVAPDNDNNEFHYGIYVGVAAGALLIITVTSVCIICRRRRKIKESAENQGGSTKSSKTGTHEIHEIYLTAEGEGGETVYDTIVESEMDDAYTYVRDVVMP